MSELRMDVVSDLVGTTAPGPALTAVVGRHTILDVPEIRAFADEVAASLTYSFACNAASPGRLAVSSPMDDIVAEFLDSRGQPARHAYRTRARALLAQPVTRRATHFGRFAQVDPAAYAEVGAAGLDALAEPRTLDGRALGVALERARASTQHSAQPDGDRSVLTPPAKPGLVLKPPKKADKPKIDLGLTPDDIAGLKYNQLRLFIKYVECLEETDEPVGSDEINMGGTVTSATGETRVIAEFVVSDDFDEGEAVFYPPPSVAMTPKNLANGTAFAAFEAALAAPGRLFAEWDIRRDVGWPTTYFAAMAMTEKDDGGFWKFLKQLAKQIIAAIEQALGKSVGTAVGAVIGGVIGSGWGAVIGAVVGFVIGALIDLLFGDNPDDIVGVAPLMVSFAAATKSYYEWTGLLAKPHPGLFPVDLTGDGGHYRVWCYFQLSSG